MAFSIFGKKTKAVLGIDLGGGSVKIVEFKEEKNRPLLHTYAFAEVTKDATQVNLMDDAKSTGAFLKKMLKEAKTDTTRAVMGLSTASVFSSIISVPASSGKEFKTAILWQAKKLVPLPLEEMILDWKVVADEGGKPKITAAGPGLLGAKEQVSIPGVRPPKEKEGPPELGKAGMRVLLTGAAKKLVEKYKEIAGSAGLELAALETESSALIRSLAGRDPSTIMIVDFGTSRTSYLVVRAGLPVLMRSITLGGLQITQAVMRALGVSEEDAEQIKRSSAHLARVAGEKGAVPPVLAKTLEPLITEARYSMSLYQKQQAEAGGGKKIEKIVLTGGSAHLPYLAEFISGALDVSAFLGDPWARVLTHEDLRPVLDEVGSRFAVAIGLAMRDFYKL